MTGIAVDHHRDRHAVRDPPGDRDALAHRRHADIGEPGIGADHAAGADEQSLAACLLHDPGVRRARWMQHRQHLVAAVDQLLQSGSAGIAHRFPPYGWYMVAPAGMLVERQFPR